MPITRLLALALLLTGRCTDGNCIDVKPDTFKGEGAVARLNGTESPSDGAFVHVPKP